MLLAERPDAHGRVIRQLALAGLGSSGPGHFFGGTQLADYLSLSQTPLQVGL